MKKTILIFGASSFVGSNLLEELKSEYRVIGTYFKNSVVIPGVLTLPCDILKKESVTTIVGRLRPDVVIYAVGMSTVKESSLKPKEAESLNSVGAVNCLMAAERVDAKFVYISSAFVFGGEAQLFKEGDVPFSNTVYGSNLSSTEFYIQRSSLNYLILRCSNLYGRGFKAKGSNWFEELEKAYLEQNKFEVDDQVVQGFLDVRIFSRILMAILESSIHNRLLNISSSDYMTRFQFAQNYGKIFKKDANFLLKSQTKFPFDRAKQSDQTSISFRLDIKNIEALLGMKMPTIDESLHSTFQRLKN